MEEAGRDNGPMISAVIISCNEADVIAKCLRSVADWVDEIVVVDMQSTDATREIARTFTKHLYSVERLAYGDPARNAAIQRAKGDWVIMLDPDERVSDTLAVELQKIARQDLVDVVIIPYQNFAFGRRLVASGYQYDAHPRFFRRGTISWPTAIHQHPQLAGLRVMQLPRDPSLAIQHDSWRTIASAYDRILRYGPHEVDALRERGERFTVHGALIAGTRAWTDSFIVHKGYRDGVVGLWVSMILGIYRIAIHMMLWEREGKPLQGDRRIRQVGRLAGAAVHVLRLTVTISRWLRRQLPRSSVAG